MTRAECEKRILEKLKEIENIHKEYNPNANYLSLSIRDNGYHFNNSYWVTIDEIGEDADYPINYNEYEKED